MTICRVLVVFLALAPTASSQARSVGIRVSEEVSYGMADKKVLPDISDLKGHKLNAEVAVLIVISGAGDVTRARAAKGELGLVKRAEEAALKWHYRPYILNGSPIEVHTMIHFRFKGNKVEAVVPPR